MQPDPAYEELSQRLKEAAVLESIGELLGWDQESYMPPKGAGLRSEQAGLTASLAHQKHTDPRIGELLSRLEASDLVKDPGSCEAVNIREARRDFDKRTKLPAALVAELAKTATLAQGEWAQARKDSDFGRFAPWLEKLVSLVREKSAAYGTFAEPYDALLDDYEPGTTAAETGKVFAALRVELSELLSRLAGAPKRPDPALLSKPFDVGLQKVFAESVISAMGFDFREGRLDVTTHPFCTGLGPGDTRILTRYNPSRLNDGLFGAMHEAGHALYEMGLDKGRYFGLAMGLPASVGMHESQSRLWENMVGRSKPFWRYFFPQAQRLFRSALADAALDDFHAALNEVKPSFIRIEADEVSYNLHILLRFELERALLSGELKPADVPGEWNARFKKYLGLDVSRDADGCLQDIHWSAALFGYFPTYTLGNLYAAQLFEKARQDLPDLDDRLAGGSFSELLGWLRANVHQHGRRYPAARLCERATGKSLSHRPLMDYLNQKYSEIYHL